MGNWGRRKERKRDEGLSARCVILTQLLLHGNEPKKKSVCSGKVQVLVTQMCGAEFCIAGRTWFLFCASTLGLGKTLLFP